MPSKHRARSQIQAGDMRKPIHILVRSDTQDAASGAVPTYTDLFGTAVWSQDQHKGVKQVDEAGKLVTATYHMYTVRYNTLINAEQYIQDPDFANLAYIQGVVDPDGQRHWMVLTCADVED